MQHERATTVLVAPGPLDHIGGGAPMRWRSLYRGLQDHGDVSYFEVPCPRESACDTCPNRDRLIEAAAKVPFASLNCQRQLDRLIAHLDAVRPERVVVTDLRLHGFVHGVAAHGSSWTVIDFHNVESDLREQLRRAAGPGSAMALRYDEEYCERVREIEAGVIRRADQTWVCSDHDAQVLSSLHGAELAGKIHTMPNSVAVPAAPPDYSGPPKVVFTAHLGYVPNVRAAHFLIEQVAPRLRVVLPEARIVLAGYGCDDALRTAIARTPNATLIDEPDDPLAVISGGIAAIPLTFGGGTRFKALEAMSVLTPVVSTAKGVEGLGLGEGEHYLRAESPDEFIASITRLTADDRLREHLTANSMSLLRERYSHTALSVRVGQRLADLSWRTDGSP